MWSFMDGLFLSELGGFLNGTSTVSVGKLRDKATSPIDQIGMTFVTCSCSSQVLRLSSLASTPTPFPSLVLGSPWVLS